MLDFDDGCKEGLAVPIENYSILEMLPEFHPESESEPIDMIGAPVFKTGLYGDVPLTIVDSLDFIYNPTIDHNKTIVVPNMRTIWRKTYSPNGISYN